MKNASASNLCQHTYVCCFCTTNAIEVPYTLETTNPLCFLIMIFCDVTAYVFIKFIAHLLICSVNCTLYIKYQFVGHVAPWNVFIFKMLCHIKWINGTFCLSFCSSTSASAPANSISAVCQRWRCCQTAERPAHSTKQRTWHTPRGHGAPRLRAQKTPVARLSPRAEKASLKPIG